MSISYFSSSCQLLILASIVGSCLQQLLLCSFPNNHFYFHYSFYGNENSIKAVFLPHLLIYSIIYLYHYGLMNIYCMGYNWVLSLFILWFKLFQLQPLGGPSGSFLCPFFFFLTTPFLASQDVPGLSFIFPVSGLESTNSPIVLVIFLFFRNQSLGAKCAHFYCGVITVEKARKYILGCL